MPMITVVRLKIAKQPEQNDVRLFVSSIIGKLCKLLSIVVVPSTLLLQMTLFMLWP